MLMSIFIIVNLFEMFRILTLTLFNSSFSALPLGPDQVLLRGAVLKNTNWIFGRILLFYFYSLFSSFIRA